MKFKKSICLFLTFFILLLNSNVQLVMHFCHEKMAYVTLNFKAGLSDVKNTHNCCESAAIKLEKNKCCSDKKVNIAKKIDQSVSKDFSFFALNIQGYKNFFSTKTLNTATKNSNLIYNCLSNAPPFYKLYSQLIFYA